MTFPISGGGGSPPGGISRTPPNRNAWIGPQTLALGSRGPQVKHVQTALNFHLRNELPPLPVNGIFDASNQVLVNIFQEKYGLARLSGGAVDGKTWNSLFTVASCRYNVLILRQPSYETLRKNTFGSGQTTSPRLFPPRGPGRKPLSSGFQARIPPHLAHMMHNVGSEGFLKNTKFDLEAGVEQTFPTRLGTISDEAELTRFIDFRMTYWTQPPTPGAEFTAGTGACYERSLLVNADQQATIYAWCQWETKYLTLGQIELLQFSLQLQASSQVNGPPDFETTIGAGREFDLGKKGRFTFGLDGSAAIDIRPHGYSVYGKLGASFKFGHKPARTIHD